MQMPWIFASLIYTKNIDYRIEQKVDSTYVVCINYTLIPCNLRTRWVSL